jgi:vacuolar-type H+-ATPase subunit C/Vma6
MILRCTKSGSFFLIGSTYIKFTYTCAKTVSEKPFHYFVSVGTDDLWMADLIDMIKYEKWNDGTRYILLVIDTLSKMVWLRSLKQKKTGTEVMEAFKNIFSMSARTPRRLVTYKGTVF